MTVDVTKVACAYIAEATKFIDSLRFGINCHDDNKLFRLELDFFMSQNNCDTEWCYDFLLDPPLCSTTINCELTLVEGTIESLCIPMGLIKL